MSKKDELRALTKADPFLESLQKLGAFFRSHQTVVVASIVAFLLVGAGVAFGFSRADKQSAAASKLLAEAQKTFDKMPLGDTPPPPAAESSEEKYNSKDEWRAAVEAKLGAIESSYPGSAAARVAKLYRASLALDAKDATAAEAAYRAYVKDAPAGDPMLPSARMSLAATLEDQGKIDEAVAELQALAPKAKSDKTPDPIAEEALLAIARLQERSGKTEEARGTYERIKTDFPAGSGRFKAEQRLAQLPKE